MPDRPSNREAARAFFDSKKPWSVQKDLILANYLPPYLKKVLQIGRNRSLERPVLIADVFAGRGTFRDGNAGSPVHIVQAADSVAAGRYTVTFANEDPLQHEELVEALRPYPHARPYLVDSQEMLALLRRHVGDRTLFVFIDPFGVTGYEYDLLAPLVGRIKDGFSTEALINFNVNDVHKKSARNSVLERGAGVLDANTRSKIDGLDAALGGPWWREFQYDPDLDTETRSRLIVEGYVAKLKEAGFEYVGHCPIRESDASAPKYRLVHGSRHIDALTLMNDTMGNVLSERLGARAVEDIPLFGDQAGDPEFRDWERRRYQAQQDLQEIVLAYVAARPGTARKDLWAEIVKDHFLQFLRREYRQVVKDHHQSGAVVVRTPDGRVVPPGTKKGMNDVALLFPGGP